MVEVRSRKLTEKGRHYQTEIKVKSFKSKRSTFTGSLRNTLLLRGQCNELSDWIDIKIIIIKKCQKWFERNTDVSGRRVIYPKLLCFFQTIFDTF